MRSCTLKRSGLLFALAFVQPVAPAPAPKLDKIEHIIVISLENHSFDNLFGHFPGAEGLTNSHIKQTDHKGAPYKTLPSLHDSRFPDNLPNQPFAIDKYVPPSAKTHDLVHRFYQEQEEIDGGKMDRFAAVSNGLTVGYYHGSKLKLWQYAKEYTLADHFFHAAFGGSFLNHVWQICACTPRFKNAPPELVARLDANGKMIQDGAVTPDGYVINTIFPATTPHPHSIDSERLLPPQTMPTIGDRLSDKNISWAWYAGGWNNAEDDRASSDFQYHHQPFLYFKNFAAGTKARAEHLKDETDFMSDIKTGQLPAVSFYKPLGEFDLHPGYTDVSSGEAHIINILHAIEKSPLWQSSVVIITFDENGGFWDHVAPPKVDRWGPGVRVPTLIISPMAKKHYIDHTVYDSVSILKLIETRFALKPLTERDSHANDLTNALDLGDNK